MAVLGGFFGLFLGFSLLSLAEIVYWYIIKLGRKVCYVSMRKNSLE